MRKAEIRMYDMLAGWLVQDETGYHFTYDKTYLESENAQAISLTFPLQVYKLFSIRQVCPFNAERIFLMNFFYE